MLSTAKAKPESYDRYIDDCLMAWTHGEAELLKFIEHCNNQNPNISFKWESSLRGSSLRFMDMSINISQDGEL